MKPAALRQEAAPVQFYAQSPRRAIRAGDPLQGKGPW
jgi:hypothetical protein